MKEEEKLLKEGQNLDRYQRKTLDIALKYARGLVKSRDHKNAIPDTPCLIVLGGAGAGKSTVIHSIIQWVQRILQSPGDDPQSPYILATATTGAASVIIQGMTIHSAVGFQHGNKHNSLSDKKREKKRDQFKNLKFLIIDEFSMLKSDQLYQLDLRLRELKQSNRVFGGVSVILFGDPAQLPAVRGRAVYEKPNEAEYHLAYGDGSESLWRTFQAIFLTENHRQGNDQTYAELLNRIRVGQQTEDDVELLRTRVRLNHCDLKNAMYIVCERAEAHEHNVKLLNELTGTLHEVEAKIICSMIRDYKPGLKPESDVNSQY